MSVSGNIHEVLKQIQLLMKIYGEASFQDIEASVAAVRGKIA